VFYIDTEASPLTIKKMSVVLSPCLMIESSGLLNFRVNLLIKRLMMSLPSFLTVL
jgi:hypothetical protein